MTEEKPKPPPEVPKIKPLPTSNRDRRSVKPVKIKEEPVVKPQTEEKTLPPKVDNYKNYNYDYTTPSPATSDLPSEQSYSSGYNSLSGTPGYNGNYPYPYNRFVNDYFACKIVRNWYYLSLHFILRYSCSVPPVPNNQWWGETSPVAPPLPSTPVPPSTPKVDTEAQSKLDLDTRIEMLLSGMSQGTSVEPAFLSIVKKEPEDVPDCVDDIMDDDLNLNLPVPPEDNDNQSDMDEEKVSNDEEMLSPLSNPPSPFLSKEIYIKCFEAAAEQLKITREKEKLEAKSFLNNSIRNGKLIKIKAGNLLLKTNIYLYFFFSN